MDDPTSAALQTHDTIPAPPPIPAQQRSPLALLQLDLRELRASMRQRPTRSQRLAWADDDGCDHRGIAEGGGR